VYVEYWGDRQLPSLLLIHGFMGSSVDFHAALPTLTQHFYCICVDLPGHGQTPITDHDFVGTAEQILAIAPQISHLYGYSLGGRLALYLALHYPDRWHKVILESASFGLVSTQARQDRIQRDRSIACKLCQPDLDWMMFIKNWYQQPVFAGIDAHPHFAELLQRRRQNQPLALAKSLEAVGLGQQPYLGDLLLTNKVPLLVLTGEWDTKFGEIAQDICNLCDGAKLVVMTECSHNVHFQQLEQWLPLVLEFLL
jgi:2-succinyl-6-hydroxy-2,4-cyclohexadiene-1-carboxylate synthase